MNPNNIVSSKEHNLENDKNLNKKLSRIAVIIAGLTAVSLAVVKLVVGLFSGSVAVMSSAIDSMLDCLVSVLNFFALKKSSQKPDKKFNYGYSKLEALAAMLEGILIIGVGIFIFYESILKFNTTNNDIDVGASLYVMTFSTVVTFLLIGFLNHIAKKTNNLIIRADALHYRSDLYTNFSIIVALIIIKITNLLIIDAIFGIVISGYIIFSAINLIKESIFVLMDEALDEKILGDIKQIISNKSQILSFHNMTSRKSGENAYLNVHLVFEPHILLFDAHEISDEIENEIKTNFNDLNWEITAHLDPCDDRFGICKLDLRKENEK